MSDMECTEKEQNNILLAMFFEFSEFTSLFVNNCSRINFCSNLFLLHEKLFKRHGLHLSNVFVGKNCPQ